MLLVLQEKWNQQMLQPEDRVIIFIDKPGRGYRGEDALLFNILFIYLHRRIPD